MIQRKKRIVMFLPHRADPDTGVRVSADLLPLELLQIAIFPEREGYECHLVDAMVHDDYLERLYELCDGALVFASSCILGYQVAHGAEVARKIRQRFPNLPIVWGGWFPSVRPELYLQEGIADAVGLGQGEFTFWDVVQALDAGEPLDSVPGLVIERDGEIVQTANRPVVGFNDIPECPWHLIDYEEYVARQNDPGPWKVRHRLPDPWNMPPGTQVRGFSYYSSFGCPEPCTFCCSPMVTNRRWKAIPGGDLAERILELKERFDFNNLRFQDANFGVAEKRSNEFCQGLLEGGAPFWWSGYYEIETIARYKQESLDLMRDSRCHLIVIGAEAGSVEQQTQIKKKIKIPNIEVALGEMYKRGITTGCSWIIGYPGEDARSMAETLRMAAEMKYKFPGAASDIFPFRPIPGTEDFERALKLGYQPPKTLEAWGSSLEYKYQIDDIQIPDEILKTWKRYGTVSTFYDGLATEGSGGVRKAMKRISGWRLRKHNYTFPIEHKLFHMYVKLTRQTKEDLLREPEQDRTPGVTPSAPV